MQPALLFGTDPFPRLQGPVVGPGGPEIDRKIWTNIAQEGLTCTRTCPAACCRSERGGEGSGEPGGEAERAAEDSSQ